tara:strand:+ start:616 stop:861 length:246 start_codon:yes stop_codon:yes gene_type:complete
MKNFFISVVLLSSILLTGFNKISASTGPVDLSQEVSPSVTNKETQAYQSEGNQNDKEEKAQINMDDLFGSEQVFPFEPGFS